MSDSQLTVSKRERPKKFLEAACEFLAHATVAQTNLASPGRLNCTVAIGYLSLATVTACLGKQPRYKAFAPSTVDLLEQAEFHFRAIADPTPAQSALYRKYWEAVPGAAKGPQGSFDDMYKTLNETTRQHVDYAIAMSRILSPVAGIAYATHKPQNDLRADQLAPALFAHVFSEAKKGELSKQLRDDLNAAAKYLLSPEATCDQSLDRTQRHARLCQIAMLLEVRHGTNSNIVDQLPIQDLAKAAERLWASPHGRQLLLDPTPFYESYCRSLALRRDGGDIINESLVAIRKQTIFLLRLLTSSTESASQQVQKWLAAKLMEMPLKERAAAARCLAIFSRVLAHGDIREYTTGRNPNDLGLAQSFEQMYLAALDCLYKNWLNLPYRDVDLIAASLMSAEPEAATTFPSLQKALWKCALAADPASHPETANDLPVLWADFDSVLISQIETGALSVAEHSSGADWLDMLDEAKVAFEKDKKEASESGGLR